VVHDHSGDVDGMVDSANAGTEPSQQSQNQSLDWVPPMPKGKGAPPRRNDQSRSRSRSWEPPVPKARAKAMPRTSTRKRVKDEKSRSDPSVVPESLGTSPCASPHSAAWASAEPRASSASKPPQPDTPPPGFEALAPMPSKAPGAPWPKSGLRKQKPPEPSTPPPGFKASPAPSKAPDGATKPTPPTSQPDVTAPWFSGSVALVGATGLEATSSKVPEAEVKHAMAVLARHAARLDSAGWGLEKAVYELVLATARARSGEPCMAAVVERWNFLLRPAARLRYQEEKQVYAAIYARAGFNKNADKEARAVVASTKCMLLWPMRPLPQPGDGHVPSYARTGSSLALPISEIRFAHNDQYERFGRGLQHHQLEDRGILQLAMELLAGVTRLEDVPLFDVCLHGSRWYCRTGHRRLAALRLVRRWAPAQFRTVAVRVVDADKAFLEGTRGRPKLTTHRNGADCEGRWLEIRETGEAVGRDAASVAEFGSDLFRLVVGPPGAKAEMAWKGG